MKSKNLILALLLVVVCFGISTAQNPLVYVNTDEVTGAVWEDGYGYIDPASLPATLVIPVRFTNNTDARTAISNGFHFFGTATFASVEADWNPTKPWDYSYAFLPEVMCYPPACYPYFDQGIFKNDIDWGEGIVGWGFAGLTGAQGSGLPADYNDIAYTFTVTGVNGVEGDTLTMDSTWWEPANFWLWSGVAHNVDWGGAYVCKIGTPLGVALDQGAGIPNRFALNQNYPNPFNPTTTLSFDVPRRANVKIVVYNILGQPVRTLVDEELAAGSYKAEWDGTTEGGRPVASGVYLCNMQAGDFTGKVKMMMLK